MIVLRLATSQTVVHTYRGFLCIPVRVTFLTGIPEHCIQCSSSPSSDPALLDFWSHCPSACIASPALSPNNVAYGPGRTVKIKQIIFQLTTTFLQLTGSATTKHGPSLSSCLIHNDTWTEPPSFDISSTTCNIYLDTCLTFRGRRSTGYNSCGE